MPTTRLVSRARSRFRGTKHRPTLIIVDSIIGYGAPHKQNTAAAHSDALGKDEVRLAKQFYGWPEDAQFLVPEGVYDAFQRHWAARPHLARGVDQNLCGLQKYRSASGARSRTVAARQIAGAMGS